MLSNVEPITGSFSSVLSDGVSDDACASTVSCSASLEILTGGRKELTEYLKKKCEFSELLTIKNKENQRFSMNKRQLKTP
jgi:hypothetical protein